MISEAPTIKSIQKNIFLLLILFSALILRLRAVKEIFPFDHDQQVGAEAAFNLFVNHKVSLIGQELSYQGFFLGPLHNWIQFVPYGVCSLKPDCAPYFFSTIGVILIVVTYLVIKKIFDRKVAILSVLLYGFSFTFISYEIGVNSNFFTYLSALVLLYCTYNYFAKKNNYLIIGGFVAGIATVNFNPIFIFTTLAFFISALTRKNRNFYLFTLAIIAFLINYLPLVLFNIRHENLLGKSLGTFLRETSTTRDYAYHAIFNLKNISLPFYSNYFFQNTHFIFLIITVGILLTGAKLFIKAKSKYLLFIPIWMVVVNLGFIFYNGPIPEYYFQQTLLPVTLMAAVIFSRKISIFILFATLFLFLNLQKLSGFNSQINYQAKKQVVNYIIVNASSETFNVYFDFPPGLNTGYEYLFKINNRLPIEGGENLFVVGAGDDSYFLKYRFQRSYPEKNVKEKIFNNAIRVVSIVD